MIKKFLWIFVFVLCVFVFRNIVDSKLSELYGQRYKVENVAYMYWYPTEEITNISYYKLDKGEVIYCKDQSGKFILCAWKFSLLKDPLFGWIKTEKINQYE
jgi:hypothetical protein